MPNSEKYQTKYRKKHWKKSPKKHWKDKVETYASIDPKDSPKNRETATNDIKKIIKAKNILRNVQFQKSRTEMRISKPSLLVSICLDHINFMMLESKKSK